ncbi:hypothetical protein [Clostridium polynesiense]|uniref:hypothetical protein n=1 Tax=Clostridium polynesiense TaxID=1325933 RepID=UPI00058FAA61|nr:hypothetical protein [Clostridium polynesiense]
MKKTEGLNNSHKLHKAIDDFYEGLEKRDKYDLEKASEDNIKKDLYEMKTLMDKVKDKNLENIDFLSIISEGEALREDKEDKKENVYFLVSAFAVLFLLFTLGFLGGFKVFIAIQLVVTFIIITFFAYSCKKIKEER